MEFLRGFLRGKNTWRNVARNPVPEPAMLRLRQIALVARELAPVERTLTDTLKAEVCYRDPGVGKYGLHNALWALGGTFLEVVAPTQPNTAGGRYLDRRKGDGGYMYIVDCDDLEARRKRFETLGVRMVEDLASGDEKLKAEAIHLHPRDTGGCLLSVDRHGPDATLMGSYRWAGADWHSKARRDVAITGATMQCDDPLATAERWGEILELAPRRIDDGFELTLDNAFARFVPLADDRGEGLSAVTLSGAPAFTAGGVRFEEGKA
jgi:Glyoxalase-like domain